MELTKDTKHYMIIQQEVFGLDERMDVKVVVIHLHNMLHHAICSPAQIRHESIFTATRQCADDICLPDTDLIY